MKKDISPDIKSDRINTVIIEPGCTTCGTCSFIAPEVFEVTDKAYVRPNVNRDLYAQQIEEAVKLCPVSVIKIINNLKK